MKLLKERYLECSICTMFFSSSLTVSMTALLRSRILSLRTHEHVPHIVAHARDELYSVDEEHPEKGLADIASVPAELAPDVLHVALVPERLAVIGVTGVIMKLSISPRSLMIRCSLMP